MSDELHYLTIAEAAGLIAARELSPVELTTALLKRIEAVNDKLDAFIHITAERAFEQAKAAEDEIQKGSHRGPMHGIPFALKDIYDTAGVPTTGHSHLTKDRVPAEDATVTRRLLEAGGVLLGKLATHEFATGGPSFDLPWPPARNPWNLERFTGGSSSGSAAAVAAGLAPGAMGSDTGGSVRLPAAFSGIAGIKPTLGRVSKRGVLPLSYSLDTCGPLAWTVEDCAIMLQAIAGFDAGDPTSADVPVPDFRAGLNDGIKGLKIGAVRHFYEKDRPASAATIAAMNAAIEVLGGLGAEIHEVALPSVQDFQACMRVIAISESFTIYGDDMRVRPEKLGEVFRYRIFPGALLGGVDYVQALRQQRAIATQVIETLGEVDLLLSATTFGPAPKISGMRAEANFADPPITPPFNVCNCPAISICNGFSDDGLPLGMQIAGRPFDEVTVLRAARAYETASEWRNRRPDVESQTKGDVQPAPEAKEAGRGERSVRAEVGMLAQHAGLDLSAEQFDGLVEAWPYVAAMAAGLPRDRDRTDELANLFGFPKEDV